MHVSTSTLLELQNTVQARLAFLDLYMQGKAIKSGLACSSYCKVQYLTGNTTLPAVHGDICMAIGHIARDFWLVTS